MIDILMLPFQGPMYAELHEHAAKATGRSYYVAGDLIDARDHLEAEGMPKLAVIDFGWTRGLTISNASVLNRLQRVPTILIFGLGGKSSADEYVRVIATLNAEDQTTSVLPNMINAAIEYIDGHAPTEISAKSFKADRDKVFKKPSRPVDLLTLPARKLRT